jgi:hypothetical protein
MGYELDSGMLSEGMWVYSLQPCSDILFYARVLCSAPLTKRQEHEDNTPESESQHHYLSSRQVAME